jgi:hypothetical protein
MKTYPFIFCKKKRGVLSIKIRISSTRFHNIFYGCRTVTFQTNWDDLSGSLVWLGASWWPLIPWAAAVTRFWWDGPDTF